MAQPEKTCLSCGRRITWRKKWERDWDLVRYCSQGCRRRGVSEDDTGLEATLRALLAQRPRGATVTDVELARAASVTGPEQPGLEPARRAARRLHASGEVEILQRGRAVDPSRVSGPFDIRARR